MSKSTLTITEILRKLRGEIEKVRALVIANQASQMALETDVDDTFTDLKNRLSKVEDTIRTRMETDLHEITLRFDAKVEGLGKKVLGELDAMREKFADLAGELTVDAINTKDVVTVLDIKSLLEDIKANRPEIFGDERKLVTWMNEKIEGKKLQGGQWYSIYKSMKK